jgi:hypothetical protein
MPREMSIFAVRLGELGALQARVVELAGPDERDCAERLLGQLAGLSANAGGQTDDAPVEFVPIPLCQDLAQRALESLDSPPFGGGRFRRRRWRHAS